MSSDPSPFFPPELEREIFEIAAYFHPETISSLVLVSRRVYECNHKYPESMIPGIAALKPRRLCMLILRDMDPRQSVFALLTHLDLFDLRIAAPRLQSSFVAQLPVLTHFAAFFDVSPGRDFSARARDILAACKSLRVLVSRLLLIGGSLESLPTTDDVRFIYMVLPYSDIERGWIAQTRGGTDHWARAEAFVEKKRRGETQPASRCFIEPADGIPECGSFLISGDLARTNGIEPVVGLKLHMTSPGSIVGFDFLGICAHGAHLYVGVYVTL
ncbi:hypothetical protein DFH08DRAFT_945319 [Mycena albidolilacea]|uniref:Uncharacterized protein n=1 Tax=Mycena albidolilacea TaxID=1033008 RepID=A0AAD6Z2B0_9AGAR|nr:hypothetical protein DFH08DRAFT_945319 [Mycena albidolilacea]